jgi:hypothetical protein
MSEGEIAITVLAGRSRAGRARIEIVLRKIDWRGKMVMEISSLVFRSINERIVRGFRRYSRCRPGH